MAHPEVPSDAALRERGQTNLSCSIVVPVRDQSAFTEHCLDALLGADLAAEIVVVDDGSGSETQSLLAAYEDSIRIVRQPACRGFASACNAGAAAARFGDLVFLNNDTVPQRGWLDALLAYARVHPRAGAVGARLLFPDGTVQHAGIAFTEASVRVHIYRGFRATHSAVLRSRPFQAVTAACLLVPRAAFEAVGGFDEMFVNGYEDIDLCLRLRKAGYEVHYCADAVVTHVESATRGDDVYAAENVELYRLRWADRVEHDELAYYLADGLMRIRRHGNTLEVAVSPEIGVPVLAGRDDGTVVRHLRQRAELIGKLQDELRLASRRRGRGGRRPLAILGMHRSGTSLVAQLAERLGCWLGPREDLMAAHPEDNPHGYFERTDVWLLNDDLLAALGGDWWNPPALPFGWESGAELEPLRERAHAIVESFAGARWAIKDPRLSFTLPFWQRVAGPLDVVVCIRDPREVVASLVHRYRTVEQESPAAVATADRWSEVWLRYVEAALSYADEADHLVVDHRRLLVDPATQVARLARFVGASLDERREAELVALVDTSLWRQRDAAEYAGVAATAHKRYRALQTLATDEPRTPRRRTTASCAPPPAAGTPPERDRRFEPLLRSVAELRVVAQDRLHVIEEMAREQDILRVTAAERLAAIEEMAREQDILRVAAAERLAAIERMARERTLLRAVAARLARKPQRDAAPRTELT